MRPSFYLHADTWLHENFANSAIDRSSLRSGEVGEVVLRAAVAELEVTDDGNGEEWPRRFPVPLEITGVMRQSWPKWIWGQECSARARCVESVSVAGTEGRSSKGQMPKTNSF